MCIYRTTEHVYLSTKLQKTYLSTALQKTCTYLPNYRICVHIYRTTENVCITHYAYIYISNYGTRVSIYRNIEHVWLCTELKNTCTYPPNYRTRVHIYPTTEHLYLSIELHPMCTYLPNYRPSITTHRTTQQHSSLFTVIYLCIPIMTNSNKFIIGKIWGESNSQSLVLLPRLELLVSKWFPLHIYRLFCLLQ